MSTINISCTDQVLALTNEPIVASGGVNEDYVQFTFDNLWNGYSKVAIFYKNPGQVYYSLIDTDNKALIPAEVIIIKGTIILVEKQSQESAKSCGIESI